MKVLKYRVDDVVTLPLNYTIVSCQEMDHTMYIWALVDPEETQQVQVSFKIVGTGKDIDTKQWKHLTTLIDDDRFVWHVFIDKN